MLHLFTQCFPSWTPTKTNHGASLGGRVSAGRPGHPRAPDEIRDLFQDLHGHLLGLGFFFGRRFLQRSYANGGNWGKMGKHVQWSNMINQYQSPIWYTHRFELTIKCHLKIFKASPWLSGLVWIGDWWIESCWITTQSQWSTVNRGEIDGHSHQRSN